jgi:hypothetical protein
MIHEIARLALALFYSRHSEIKAVARRLCDALWGVDGRNNTPAAIRGSVATADSPQEFSSQLVERSRL